MIRLILIFSGICILLLACSDFDLERVAFLKVNSLGISELGTNSVTLVGGIENLRSASLTETGFVLSSINQNTSSLLLEKSNNRIIVNEENNSTAEGIFFTHVEDLEPGTHYFFRAYAKILNSEITSYGNIDSFTTSQLNIQILSLTRSGIGCPTTANIQLQVAASGIELSEVEIGVAWQNNVIAIPEISGNSILANNVEANGTTTIQLPVNCNEFYSIRAYIDFAGDEIFYSSEIEFTADPGGQWYELPQLPQQIDGLNSCIKGFATREKGIVYGTPNNTLDLVSYEFDPKNFSWTQINDPLLCGQIFGNKEKRMRKDLGSDVYYEYREQSDEWVYLDQGPEAFHAFDFILDQTLFLGLNPVFENDQIYAIDLNDFSNISILELPWVEYSGGYAFFQIKNIGYVGLPQIFTGELPNRTISEQSFWAYKMDNNVWRSIADFPEAIINKISFSTNNKGYVLTGIDSEGNVHPGFWEYDPDIDEWARLKDFGRADLRVRIGFVIDDIIYAGFGVNAAGEFIQEFWKYVPEL